MFSSGRLLRQLSSEPDENSLGTADSRSHMRKAAACATWFATRSPLRVQAMVAPADRDEFGAEQALQQLAAIEMAAVVLVERRSSSSFMWLPIGAAYDPGGSVPFPCQAVADKRIETAGGENHVERDAKP
jgi:hypothetical protein